MITDKPNLMLGESKLPKAVDLRSSGKRSALNAPRPVQQSSDFAAFLPEGIQNPFQNKAAVAQTTPAEVSSSVAEGQSPSTTPVAVASTPKGQDSYTQRRNLLAAGDNLALSQALQSKNSSQQQAARVTTPISRRMNFGMEDTRPGVRSQLGKIKTLTPSQEAALIKPPPQAGATAQSAKTSDVVTFNQQVQSNVSSINPETAAKVLQNTTSPIKTINSAPQGITLGNAQTPVSPAVALTGAETGRLVLQAPKVAIPDELQFGSALLQGDSTQALLKAFREIRPAPEILAERKALLAQNTASQPQRVTAQSYRPNPVANLGNNLISTESGLGALAAKFESGEMGIAAIGFDQHGGTSYGKYQISSRAGTMKGFIAYLQDKAPDIAEKLSTAGPANTGSRNGKMPAAWKQIAQDEPARFEVLQDDFIKSSHFEPAMTAIAEATGVPFGEVPQALQEVIFSTAVQHGPAGAAKIVNNAVQAVASQGAPKDAQTTMDEGQELIKKIYSIRSRQFGSSTGSVRAAVQNRLRDEMQDALAMLRSTNALPDVPPAVSLSPIRS